MKNLLISLLLSLFIVQTAWGMPPATSSQAAVKTIQPSQQTVVAMTPTPLNNADIVGLVKANLTAEIIIAKIKSAACHFETTPAALQQLKTDGVPDAVILAMLNAPSASGAMATMLDNKAAAASVIAPPPQTLGVKLPPGTPLDVEIAYTISSQDVRAGEPISFRVINPVLVDGVVVIDVGATATARVVKASRGGHWGRAGRIAWAMQDVTAVDGTRIPLVFAGRIVGDSKGAKVATQMILTGALLPLIAPVALLHGFKRGENALIPAGKRFEVAVSSEATVMAVRPPR